MAHSLLITIWNLAVGLLPGSPGCTGCTRKVFPEMFSAGQTPVDLRV